MKVRIKRGMIRKGQPDLIAGQSVELAEGEARPLIRDGYAVPAAESKPKASAAELIAQIQAADTIADMDALVSGDEERTTVLAAYEQRFRELDGDPEDGQ